MTKFQKFWVPEYFLYRYTFLIKIQPKVITIIFTSKFSLSAQLHLTIFVWQSTARETSHIFIACFLAVKIMLIYAKIQQLTWMSRSLQNVNLKIFCVAYRHKQNKIPRPLWKIPFPPCGSDPLKKNFKVSASPSLRMLQKF